MKNRKLWLIADTHFGYKCDDDEWFNDYVSYFEDIVISIMKEKVEFAKEYINKVGGFEKFAEWGLF